MKDAIDRLKLIAEPEQLLAEATAPNDDPATMDIDSVLAVSAERICPLMNVKCAALVLIDKQRERIAELETHDSCHKRHIGELEAVISNGQYANQQQALKIDERRLCIEGLNKRIAEMEQRIANLADVFTCSTCGAMYSRRDLPDAAWEGVTQCGKCVEVSVLRSVSLGTIHRRDCRIAELEAGLQLAQATCAVYSEKVDMLESQLAAQESAHDPQP